MQIDEHTAASSQGKGRVREKRNSKASAVPQHPSAPYQIAQLRDESPAEAGMSSLSVSLAVSGTCRCSLSIC